MKKSAEKAVSKIIIAGAGPAGTSLAIRLARQGFSVTLIEREKFPRRKLCGEFISPECFAHFEKLGVLREILVSGGDRISETFFYAPDGKYVKVPSRWFTQNETALGLSRAEMDFRLLEKAREVGVNVLEETGVSGLIYENRQVCGVKMKMKSETNELAADLVIDATGRARILGKIAEKELSAKTHENIRKRALPANQTRLVGFKTHLKNAEIIRGRCEIYFFRGGYGGLNLVENSLANHCFLIDSKVVREFGGDAEKIVENVVFKNERAFAAMHRASPVFDWLAVSVESFGAQDLSPARNLLAVGDAGAFIDPFTGSGMLMALESAEILAQTIKENPFSAETCAEIYRKSHFARFRQRLFLCNLLRRAAFSPRAVRAFIAVLGSSRLALEFMAKSTRLTTRI